MLLTLRNIIQLLSSNSLFVIIILSPFPALAIAAPPQEPPAPSEQPSPESSHMSHRAIFGIVFVLLLFLFIEAGYAYVGSRTPLTWLTEVSSLIRAASGTVMRRLSSLRFFKFFEKAADAMVGANDNRAPSTHGRSGGMSRGMSQWTGNLPTVPQPAPVHIRRHRDSSWYC